MQNDGNIPTVEKKEVMETVLRIRRGKDIIDLELIRRLGEVGLELLWKLFKEAAKTKQILDD